MPNKLREILEKLYDYAVNSTNNDEEYDEFYNKRLNQAEQQIRDLIPKEEHLPDNNAEYVCQSCGQLYGARDFGFNQAIQEMKDNLR